jgi:predicted nucleotide-binding protein
MQKTGGSMVGSKRYELPSNLDNQAALLYQFFLGIHGEKYDVIDFAINIYGGRRFDSMIRDFNNDITSRLVRILNRKLDECERNLLVVNQQEKESELSANPTAVFVVHGRNMKARDAMFTFLRSVGLKPIEGSQAIKMTGKGSPYVGEVLDVAFSNAQAIVVLMTPDDEARLRAEFLSDGDPDHEKYYTPQPRQNVIFEAGMAIGRDENRTILVELGQLRHMSDIVGRHTVRMNNAPEKRSDLVDRLQTAGCEVDTSGRDWFSAGDFDNSLVN